MRMLLTRKETAKYPTVAYIKGQMVVIVFLLLRLRSNAIAPITINEMVIKAYPIHLLAFALGRFVVTK
jgi:hypothetical protein